jgi:hypothetical protein
MLAEGNRASDNPCPVLPLAAMGELAENSRQGFATKKINSHRGSSEVNFKTVTGIGASLRPKGIGSRCQSLNRYAYALNNPTTFTDPTGLLCQNARKPCPPWLIPPSPNVPIGSGPFGIGSEFDYFPNPGAGPGGDIYVPAIPGSPEEQVGNDLLEDNQLIGGDMDETLGINGSPAGVIEASDMPYFFGPLAAGGPSGGGSWWGTFAKSFVLNFPSTTWHSIASSSGCINQFLWSTLGNLNPFSAGPGPAAEAAGTVYTAVKFNQALNYAATTPSATFGTPFLVYPQNSNVYRGLMEESASGAAVGALGSADLAMFEALVAEYNAAKVGGCN